MSLKMNKPAFKVGIDSLKKDTLFFLNKKVKFNIMMYQHNFFEKTAKKFPNAIAVDDHGKKISYKQLDIFANKIANLILSSGFSTNERICILTKKKYKFIC